MTAQGRSRGDRRTRWRHRCVTGVVDQHAGTPWELGLAETQQTLVLNKLRSRIRVQADGQMKTGRDVVIGALLGADEFGFATAPLVVEGCIMMRKCHLNTCPVGVATQDPELRKNSPASRRTRRQLFFFVAEEVRELMAKLGVRTFDELVGHSDWLDMQAGIEHWKAKGLDFSKVFYSPKMPASVARHHCETPRSRSRSGARSPVDRWRQSRAPKRGKRVEVNAPRSATATARPAPCSPTRSQPGMVTTALPGRHHHVRFSGYRGGQSFGAFLARGVTFEIEGATNDYTGKGLSAVASLCIRTPSARQPEDNIVVGNTVMIGATEGESFFRGIAGERFCVRNSGATAVVGGHRRPRL